MVGTEMTVTVLVVSITASVVVTAPMVLMAVTITTAPHAMIMIETQEVTTITAVMIMREVREKITTLATIMKEVREEAMIHVMITTEVQEAESTIVAIIFQPHRHQSVLQEAMIFRAVQVQKVVQTIMVEEVEWTTAAANATRQTQAERHQLATNAEVVEEKQAKHQAVANAQYHQTKVVGNLKEVKVVEVEEIRK